MTQSANASFSERFIAEAVSGPVPRPPGNWSWLELMKLALCQAKKAYALNEVPVGALLLSSAGEIIASGHNTCIRDFDVSAHAEINVLREAGVLLKNYRLLGCCMVVTLEPCPMCAAAIAAARLSGIVFGAYDRLYGAISSRAEYLDPPCHSGITPWHLGGVGAEESAHLLQRFFSEKRAEHL